MVLKRRFAQYLLKNGRYDITGESLRLVCVKTQSVMDAVGKLAFWSQTQHKKAGLIYQRAGLVLV